jgi:hypothetical protein
MSMVRCEECDHLIDSDVDCDCFMEPPLFGQSVLCEWCRGDAHEEQPKDPVGQSIRGVFASLDELIALANSHDTRDRVCAEKIALGQMMTRCETLLSFALASAPKGFRNSRHG